MAGLRLGPLLRYVDWESGDRATVWVEADRPCRAEVRCAGGAGGGSARTFQIEGHHYALIPVTGLTPDAATAYEVLLDGRRVWPLDGSPFPPSVIRTPAVPSDEVTVVFGSCRWAATPAGEHDPIGPDALAALAAELASGALPEPYRPDVLVLLGDQVYADQTSKQVRRWLAARRDLREPPGAEVADYEEYTRLYWESWTDPEVRWLLSTVPSCMIFDDHDLIDDWNISASWLAEMRAEPWWQERVVSGLMSYWVHQHLGNLSPAELAADELYAAVRSAPDGTDALRRFAAKADADAASARWSYRRDFGRTRLLMADTRAARVLEEPSRSMLAPSEARWLREQALDGHQEGAYDHLLIGASLPWLLPPLIHDAEGWNAALCAGVRGRRWARFSEALRRRSDLEHWAAFPASFAELTTLIAEAGGEPGSGAPAPATVCVLSGDVHHAYVAEAVYGAKAVGPAEATGRAEAAYAAGAVGRVEAADPAGRAEATGRAGQAEATGQAGRAGGAEAAYAAEAVTPAGRAEAAEATGRAEAVYGAEAVGPAEATGRAEAAEAADPAEAAYAAGRAEAAEAADPAGRDAGQRAQVFQLTCSPVHNAVHAILRLGFRFGWSRAGRRVGRALARHAGTGRPPVGWRRTGGPWFGNQLMTLALRGRAASLRLDQARTAAGGADRGARRYGSGHSAAARLATADERELTAHRDPSLSGG
ncbi:alkaline phosphatase D family protein [Streptomyces sp. PR69]|uniref:alkaline phosphatase D family protein n=1 Tax=Streptomyces sp. PR69 TaxID=2984950 RepID=UPI002263C79C|nr:alkaline phosphatase D family protein [Streptomyces sp. PR69]